MIINCNKCKNLHLKIAQNNFIYQCMKWNLQSFGILPSKIVNQSINKLCPFFEEKFQNKNDNNNNNFDIFI